MRRKRQKFTIPSKYLLLIMTCVCVLFMAVTFFTDFLASPLSNFAGGVILPFQSGISKVGSWMNVRSQELKTIHTAGNKYHIRSLQCGSDLLNALLSCFLTDLRLRTCTESLCKLFTDL